LQIGKYDNATATLNRQVVEGLNAEDLSYYPDGKLQLGDDGTLPLYGNVGLSAGVEQGLSEIIGQTRVLPLFDDFSGTGAGGLFQIIGFAGVRVLGVRLVGSMGNKSSWSSRPSWSAIRSSATRMAATAPSYTLRQLVR